MGMFDSLYDDRGREWQTKALGRGMSRFSIGDRLPGMTDSYQLEVIGRGAGYWFATVENARLVSIDQHRNPYVRLVTYLGGHEAAKPGKGVYVSWTQCDCDHTTDYCDENHRVGARVPLSVLNQYDPKPIRYEVDYEED